MSGKGTGVSGKVHSSEESSREGRERWDKSNCDLPSRSLICYVCLFVWINMHYIPSVCHILKSILNSQNDPDQNFSQKVHSRYYPQASIMWYEGGKERALAWKALGEEIKDGFLEEVMSGLSFIIWAVDRVGEPRGKGNKRDAKRRYGSGVHQGQWGCYS